MGAALLAACGDDDASTPPPGDAGAMSDVGGGRDMDLTLLRTAASVEALAVAVYTDPAVREIVSDPTLLAAAHLFAEHHQSHQDLLNGVLTAAGQVPVTDPDQVTFDALVQPVLDDPSEAKVLRLALDLEDAAQRTHVFAGGELSTPGLRSTIMTIGGVEARHFAALTFVTANDVTAIFPEQRAFVPSERAVPQQP